MVVSFLLVLVQEIKVKFQLDWCFEGLVVLFLVVKFKGYFVQEKLDVIIDVGNGLGNVVNCVVFGIYDMGFVDMVVLMEFIVNNFDVLGKLVVVMMVYNDMLVVVFLFKKFGIKKFVDLVGKKLGVLVFDVGCCVYLIFVKVNGFDVSKV